jgi:membrane protease YdiL (CAAX protease family)
MLKDSSSAETANTNQPRTGSWIAPFALLGVVVVFLSAQAIGGLLLYKYGFDKGMSEKEIASWLETSVGAQFAFLLISESLVLLGIYALMKFLRWSREMIGLTRPKLSQIAIGLIAGIPYYLIYITVLVILTHFIPSLNADQKQEIGFDDVKGTAELAMTFVSLVVLPPLVEEIAMRGFLYSGLRKWLPKIAAALVVSILFGVAHLGEGGAAGPLWVGALDTFTLSLVLVYLREKTGNLWAGITLHALKNGIAFVLLFVVGVN